MAQAESPVMLTAVRPMSKILSTPATRAMPSTGRLTDCKTMESMTMLAPGTPAVPIDARVAVKTNVSICEKVKSMPKHEAIKIAQTP